MHSLRRQRQGVAMLLVLGMLIFVLDVYATHLIFTSKYPGANDFYSRWRGAEVFWREGVNPYSDEATLAIQLDIYGRAAQADEDPGPFAYPFYTVFLLLPLVWLPYPWVQAIWLTMLEFSLVCGVFLCLLLVNWRLPAWLLALTGLWTVFFYHSARTILLGQFAGLVFLWIVATLWTLKHKHDFAAGGLLALTTIKPQMSFLLIPALLLWGLGQRRWRFLGSFGIGMAVLVGASFLLLPSWLTDFLRQLVLYPSYTAIGSPVWILTHYYLTGLGTPVELGLSVLLLLYLVLQWRHLPRADETSGTYYWIVGLTLIVTNLVALRTATTNYIVLYIPLFFALKVVADHRPGNERLLALFYVLTTAGSWALFLATVQDRFEHPIMYLPLPIGLFLAFMSAKAALQGAFFPRRYAAT